MIKNKKAEEQSIWRIIGLILAVLILLSYIFFIRKPISNVENLDNCENLGGKCSIICRSDEIPNKIFKCQEPNQVCCVSIES